ncbi:MAG: threonine--tRNA ligase [Legionellales bacterium]|jgi:threonyl-tRNA synthetase|nr:threonine--tRNA ligase [Legionellales bacterium]
MLQIKLPDGSIKSYDESITALDVCKSIGPGLAKSMLAAEINGKLVDATTLINEDVDFKVITAKDNAGIDVIRHSTAHLLAQAVKSIYPAAQVTIGPVIEDGFYYDFYYPPGFKEADLEKIEKKMQELVAADLPVIRNEIEFDKAVEHFESIGEQYKAEIIKDIGDAQLLTTYTQGDFTDLCRGPHVPSTACLGVFKLTKLAGAYWRGDSNNPMLQRIYGTAWATKSQLKDYLYMIEEAQKRDHRKLGQKLNLFHLQEEAPGMIFWHPAGWEVYQLIVKYVRDVNKRYGYKEISTPQILDKSLWEKSGHWDKFQENMYVTQYEDKEYAVKPMSCPGHIQVFNNALHSYKELPIKFSEFGCCHRKEPSGSLHGIMRVRGFLQDDGHIFCTEAQIKDEVNDFIRQVFEVYKHFGFDNSILVKLSTRPEKRVGAEEVWDKAEQALEASLNESKLDWELLPGEGAFYGPKLEFSLKDCLGRVQQCGTIQLDFSMPERLGAKYVDSDNTKKTPVMLHRAVLGSVERFLGLLLEEYAGALPFWLAPMQIVVASITENQLEYVASVVENLAKNGLRVKSDLRNEKIGYKIREHSMSRIPYVLVCGDREVEAEQVAVRDNSGKNIGAMSVAEFLDMISDVK